MAEQPMFKRVSIQSQHPSFEDPVTVHPLRNLLLSIRDEIEQEAVHQLISLCKDQLGDQFGELVNECDILAFFNVLEFRHGTEYAVNFIETCLEHEQLHGDFGSCKLSDQVQQYKKEKVQYLSECTLDPNFVGREDCMADIIHTLKTDTKQCLGIVIYGESGIGKSSLAREVCHKLRNSDTHWLIKPVNLRGVGTFREFLQSLLMNCFDCCLGWNLETHFLRSKVLNVINDMSIYKCIIWLDNVDSLCDTADEFKSCEDFLNEITSLLHKEDASQTKLLVTLSTDKPPSVSHYIKMVKLSRLSSQDTHQFLRQQSDIPEESCLCKLCGTIKGHPLALRITASLLRSGKSTDAFDTHSRDFTEPESTDYGFDRIFETAYFCLDKTLQTLMMKLTVFCTIPFSLENAVCVTSDNITYSENSKHVKRDPFYNLMAELTQLRLLNFIEHSNTDQESHSGSQFSLHPQVLGCLQQLKMTHDFDQVKDSFCKHFCAMICSYVKKLDCDEDKRMKSNWHQNFQHFKTWFHYIISGSLPADQFYGNNQSRPMLLQCRIWRVAQTVLRAPDQLTFLQQQTKLANHSREWLPAALWLLFQAEWFIYENQSEIAVQVMTQLPEDFKTLSPEVIGRKDDIDDTVSKLHASLRQIIENHTKTEVFEVITFSAFICKNHGILLKMNQNLLESKHYLKEALRLFSGKIRKVDISKEVCKEIKQSFKFEVAKLQKCLTTVRRDSHISASNTQKERQQAWLTSRVNRKRSSSDIYDTVDTSVDSACSFDKYVESDGISNVKEHEHDIQKDSLESAHNRIMVQTTRHYKERKTSDSEISRSLNRLESQSSVTSLMDSLTTQPSGSVDDESLMTTSLNTDNG